MTTIRRDPRRGGGPRTRCAPTRWPRSATGSSCRRGRTARPGVPRGPVAGRPAGRRPARRSSAELDAWARLGVDGWFAGEAPWLDADERHPRCDCPAGRCPAVEVATLNTLTVNLHLLLASFYRPAGERTAILIDAPTFPSDRYAVESQLRLHGLDPARDLIVVRPRDGEALLRIEDLEGAIHEHRDRLALALLAGVNYATGPACSTSAG